MDWTERCLRYYGFRQPYDMPTALLALTSALFLAVVAVAGLLLYANGQLTFWSPRALFIAYLMVVLTAAMVLSRRQRLALVLLCLCLVEIGLASVSAVASEWGSGRTLFPADRTAEQRFEYHPLLQKVPKPGFGGAQGTLSAFRQVLIKHNGDGFRGSEIPGLDNDTRLIIAYGGSTTYDLGVDQGQTWVEQLQRLLGSGYTVLNFGVPGYTTQEHLIQTAFYGDFRGTRPRCAIYYIGWNDIRNAHLPNLDRGYADYHALSQLDNFRLRDAQLDGVRFSPLALLLARWVQVKTSVIPLPPSVGEPLAEPANDPRLETIYRNNLAALHALNRSRQVTPIFVGQVLNRAQLTAETSYGWLPRVQDRHVWDLQERFNGILQAEAVALGADYIDVDVDGFEASDFVDEGHFSPAGARKFAATLSAQVGHLCR